MSNDLMLDVDQAGELKRAFRRTRGSDGSQWSNEKIKKLSEGKFLGAVMDVVDGRSQIVSVEKEYIVDCNKIPLISAHYDLEFDTQHPAGIMKLKKCGQTLFANGRKISLYVSKSENLIPIHQAIHELSGNLVLNFSILHFLLENPKLIPNLWKGYDVYFVGTYFRSRDNSLYVTFL